MSRASKEGFILHLEEQAEIKARERYWEKIFAPAHPPAEKSKKSKSKFV